MPASTLRRPAVPVAGSAVVPLISGLPVPPVPGDTTPRIMRTTGGLSHAGPGGREPHFGATKKVTGIGGNVARQHQPGEQRRPVLGGMTESPCQIGRAHV